ncbi:pentapeptide repeat-containing protein [Spirulina sp. CCNP1310]|uniref:pentapeptide repeat-containing protein n=1 Tax=Spirulina sp. CCNP1310 TaxID=3110249 RepID=UPI002B202A32|nr:pentapeptide repeat-containing protein [Spirulina sp. CCNP1310]MEA5421350.1 pentapeptide repeat-containing protein [Spirulina sp. CCNP1310]
MYGSVFIQCKFKNTNLSGSFLAGADFRSVSAENVNFSGADVRSANFSGLMMPLGPVSFDSKRINFSNAKMEKALLQRACLEGANFQGATLQGAYANSLTRWPAGFDPKAAGITVY